MSLERWLLEQRDRRAAAGLTRRLRPRPPQAGMVDLAGNDYLGLSMDPRVTQAAAVATAKWGAGAGASRLVTGSLELHAELEAALAVFTGRPGALVMSTGYHANLSVVTALADPETLIVSDAHVHASLVDGCRLSRSGGLVVTPHNDVEAVATALAQRQCPRALVLVESVYSILGDAAPLRELGEVVARHDATLVVDEAHAIGVAGPGGSGLVRGAGLATRSDVVSTMTLSKALGSQGGAVLATPDVIDHLVNTARPFIYDTGLAPAATAAALAAVDIIVDEPHLPGSALALAARMAGTLGLKTPAGSVLSVPMSGPLEALAAQSDFAADGFGVGCFRPPSVPDGVSRLRLTARAGLDAADIDRVLRRLSGLRAGDA